MWENTTGNWLTTRTAFDWYGNAVESTDARGNKTTVGYSAAYNYAYPTSVTTAVPDPSGARGSATAFTTTTTYDFNTGLPVSTTDANGQTTGMEYNDSLLRPTRVVRPDGGATFSYYSDAPGSLAVQTVIFLDATQTAQSYQYFDGLGRPNRSFQSNAANGWTASDTQYDSVGRMWRVSNPYFAPNGAGEAINPSNLWTSTSYDNLGRAVSVASPDGARVTTAYSLATAGNAIGTTVTVTDQAGKLRRSVTNALGQLARVDEPNDSGDLGIVSAPNQFTSYSYDTLGNLTTVAQGAQSRTFVYDSLARLRSAANPESGTIYYAYDANGNLTAKTDARNVSTIFGYDNLNRVIDRSYSGETGYQTPAVNYYYDGIYWNAANAQQTATGAVKGKLTSIRSTVSTTNYTAFDALGRTLSSQQITAGQTYNFAYEYNLAGALTRETYPSGRIVKHAYQSDGSLHNTTGTFNSSNKIYADSFSYTAHGAVAARRLGNNRWETAVFNSRLQPTQLGLGAAANDQNLWRVNYDYGVLDSNGNLDAARNNGNVARQTIGIPSVNGEQGFVARQNYTYDSLNRLASASETIGGARTWRQLYSFDRYGNRRQVASIGIAGFAALSEPGSNAPKIGDTSASLSNGGSDDNSRDGADNQSRSSSSSRSTNESGSRASADIASSETNNLKGTIFDKDVGDRLANPNIDQKTARLNFELLRADAALEPYQVDPSGSIGFALADDTRRGTSQHGPMAEELVVNVEADEENQAGTTESEPFSSKLSTTKRTTTAALSVTPTPMPTPPKAKPNAPNCNAEDACKYSYCPSYPCSPPPTPTSIPSPTPPPPRSPLGSLDGVDANSRTLWGWSFDPDNSSASNTIHFYIDGPAGGGGTIIGGAIANLSRTDVNNAHGIAGDHGYSFQIPEQYRDGVQHVVYAYGIDLGSDPAVLLSNSPQSFTFAPAPPPASGTLSAAPSPIQVCDGSGYGVTTISWTTSHTSEVQVRTNSPNGALFASSGAGSSSSTTGKWVHDNAVFYLQNVSNGLPLTSANTLATVTVNLTTNGCPEAGETVRTTNYNQSNNRIVDSGFEYDAAGNLTRDGASRNRFLYDAENKQIEVKNEVGTVLGTYKYDGEGKRVSKRVGGETTVFVYDAMGRLAAEYPTTAPTTPAQTNYLTNDHLGSPRVITDQIGNVISRRDFLAFGEDLYTPQRTSQLGYSADAVRQQFTGYQKDQESGLDFAKARMYGGNHGRFTSPDPLGASAKLIISRSWNRYTYVLNNPLNLVDPSGMIWGTRTFTRDGKQITQWQWFEGNKVGKGWSVYKGSSVVDTTSHGVINLNSNGTITRLGVPGTGGSKTDQKNNADWMTITNATGGLICSGSAGFACPGNNNSSEFQNAKAGADAVQYAFIVKSLIKAALSLAAIAAIIKSNPDDVAKVALGLGGSLDDFAKSVDAKTWKTAPDPLKWKE